MSLKRNGETEAEIEERLRAEFQASLDDKIVMAAAEARLDQAAHADKKKPKPNLDEMAPGIYAAWNKKRAAKAD